MRPLGPRGPDRLQTARQHVSLGKAVVGLFVAAAGILREPDLDAQRRPVMPRGALVAGRREQHRLRWRERRQRVLVEPHGIDSTQPSSVATACELEIAPPIAAL